MTRGTLVSIACAATILAAVGCSHAGQASTATAPATVSAHPTAYGPQVVLPMGDFINHPSGLAVDGGGAAYALDFYYGQVWKLAVGANSPIPLPFDQLGRPDAVAVDSAGNLYVAEELTGP